MNYGVYVLSSILKCHHDSFKILFSAIKVYIMDTDTTKLDFQYFSSLPVTISSIIYLELDARFSLTLPDGSKLKVNDIKYRLTKDMII